MFAKKSYFEFEGERYMITVGKDKDQTYSYKIYDECGGSPIGENSGYLSINAAINNGKSETLGIDY